MAFTFLFLACESRLSSGLRFVGQGPATQGDAGLSLPHPNRGQRPHGIEGERGWVVTPTRQSEVV